MSDANARRKANAIRELIALPRANQITSTTMDVLKGGICYDCFHSGTF